MHRKHVDRKIRPNSVISYRVILTNADLCNRALAIMTPGTPIRNFRDILSPHSGLGASGAAEEGLT